MYRENPAAPFIVTAFNNHVVAVEVASGRIAWTTPTPVRRCAVLNDVVVVAYIDVMKGLRYQTGELLWATPTRFAGSIEVTLLLEPNTIFVSVGGQLIALDYQGRELWQNTLPGTGFGNASLAVPGVVAQSYYGR